MQDSFVLYSNYEDKFKLLSDKDKGKLIMAIFAFVRGEDLSATLSPSVLMAYAFITQQIAIDIAKYKEICDRRRENGQLGGRPRKNTPSNDEDKKANGFKENQDENKKPNGFEENQMVFKKSKQKHNDNEYEYDNDYYKLVIKENNNNLNNAYARTRNIIYNFYIEYYKRGYPEQFIKYADEIIDAITEAVTQSQSSEGLTFNKVTYNFDMFIDIITKINQTLFCEVIDALLKNPDIRNRYYYILGVIITMASKEQNPKYTSAQIEKLKKELST